MISRSLIAFATPYRKSLFLAGALMLAESAATLSLPWLGGQFAANVLSEKHTSVNALLLVLLLIVAAQALLRFTASSVSGSVSNRISTHLRTQIYDHLQALPLSFFNERRRGDVLALLTNDAVRLTGFISMTLPTILPMIVTLAGSLVLMLILEPILAAVVLFLVPTFYFVLRVVGRRLRPLASQFQEEEAKVIAIAEENLALLPAIKAFTQEPYQSARFAEQSALALKLALTQHKLNAGLGPLVQFIAAAGVVMLLWLATSPLTETKLEPAQLISFLLYAAILTRPVESLASLYGQIQSATGALARLEQVLSEQREPISNGGATLTSLKGSVTFENVSFAYPNRPAALYHADLEIEAGETIGLIGANGAGKSTLVHLLMRFYEPDTGRILVDGLDVSELDLRSLREQIGLVSQRVLLFNASVADNIALGKPHASQSEIVAAAKAAAAHGFIERLPERYETRIGDCGIRLSGGQCQRIALARALLKEPRILVLDEATAMFDLEGENAFLMQGRKLFADRTVILITHKPTILELADRIVRLENGQLVSLEDSYERYRRYHKL